MPHQRPREAVDATTRIAAVEALHAATAIYTAEPVVDLLLDRLDWPAGNRCLVDPSCGDGMFLGQALKRLLRKQGTWDTEQLLQLIEGWEIHPRAATEARSRLASILIDHGCLPETASDVASRIVRNADFLSDGPRHPCYHAIAGNPPYLRFVSVPEILRKEYSSIVPRHARNDLLHSFLDRCAASLHPDGSIALVTADRWLFNVGAAGLRTILGERLAIHHLERLDPSTTFYRPKQRRAGTPPRIHPVAVVMRPPATNSILLTEQPIYPGQGGSTTIATGACRTLGDVAEVRLAPWLGTHGIFVVDAATAASLPAAHLVPAVDTDDIHAGELRPATRFAIRTYPDAEPPAAIVEHLQRNVHRMAARGRRKRFWLPPETWHRIPLDRPALLIPRIAKSLRPIRVPVGVLPINHNLHIVAAAEASLEELEDILNRRMSDDWIRAHAAPLEGGYYSLTTRLLRRLPIDLEDA